MRVFHQADCLESQDNHDNDDSPDRMSEKRCGDTEEQNIDPMEFRCCLF